MKKRDKEPNTFKHFLVIAILSVCAVRGQLVKDETNVESNRTIEESYHKKEVVKDIKVSCNSHDITLTITTKTNKFNGMIYPKGLAKNSTCMTEYIKSYGEIQYILPLRSCNTMSTDVTGGVEYFNTVVIQPHRKLVTNQGRGYHIRCRYETQAKNLLSNKNSSSSRSTPITAIAAMPGSTMKIFYGEPTDTHVAENVKIGDPLTLFVTIDDQDIYGMHVTQCYVRDGLGWAEQILINDDGCPLDNDIMGPFDYGTEKTTAFVHFQAHKFPYTSSVYYQCNVRLCIKHAGGCDDVPPICDSHGKNTLHRRKKRQTIELDDTKDYSYDPEREKIDVKVYSGLYVNDASDLDDPYVDDKIAEEISEKVYDSSTICFPQKDFAIGIAIAGLILMVIVIAAILCLLSKRRRRKDLSTTGSSIYSGPYTNTAYSHSS